MYASLVLTIRTSLWRYLEELHDRIKSLGDSNEVVLSTEVKGGMFVPSRANLFQN